jgi:hypothetical protein
VWPAGVQRKQGQAGRGAKGVRGQQQRWEVLGGWGWCSTQVMGSGVHSNVSSCVNWRKRRAESWQHVLQLTPRVLV